MYYKDDFLLRIIHMIIREVLKILFGRDFESEFDLVIRGDKEKSLLKKLINLSDMGEINRAENILFENMNVKNKDILLLGLKFYEHLSSFDEGFLKDCKFSHREILQGINDILIFYNLSNLSDIFTKRYL